MNTVTAAERERERVRAHMCVFNDAASSSESTALNHTVLENNDLEQMQQEVTVDSTAISLEGL